MTELRYGRETIAVQYLSGCSGIGEDEAAYALAGRVSVLPPGARVCWGCAARVALQLDIQEHVKHLRAFIPRWLALLPRGRHS